MMGQFRHDLVVWVAYIKRHGAGPAVRPPIITNKDFTGVASTASCWGSGCTPTPAGDRLG
jgi:hypothetical protein